MPEYAVELRNITKTFKGITANDDITLKVQKGEIYALLGENGAGKSTLMSVLFGMYEPDMGEIWVQGRKVSIGSPRQAAALGIGMVHQHFKLIHPYTVTENIILGAEPTLKKWGVLPYIDKKGAKKQIAELADRFGIEIDPDLVIEQSGVSMQQRVEILKMLYREAELMIFDEPTAVLTPQETGKLLEIIRSMKSCGKTIILITHKLNEVKAVADRFAVLRKGKLIAEQETSQTDTKEMARLMVGRQIGTGFVKKTVEGPSKQMPVILDVRHLTIRNKEKFALVEDVSFQIRAGEIFAIAGVAGNGQIELADALAGMLPVSSGQIILNGKEITKEEIRKRTLLGVSYVPEDRQSAGLVLDFTLQDNMGLKQYYLAPFSEHGILNRREFSKQAEQAISEYDIRCAEGGESAVRAMSGGNQQKIILARELRRESALLIAVQPTRGLDIGAIETVHHMLMEERSKGKAILLISLELDEIMSCADTIGVIYKGKLQKTGPAASVQSDAKVSEDNEEVMTKEKIGEYMMGVVRNNVSTK